MSRPRFMCWQMIPIPTATHFSVEWVSVASHGTVTVSSSNDFVTYSPDLNYFGADSFTYTVTDGRGGSAEGTVNVDVLPVNDAPAAVDDAATTGADAGVLIDVLANDTDVDGDSLEISAVDEVSDQDGSIVVNGDNTVTYRRRPDGAGPIRLATPSMTAVAVWIRR